MMEHNDYQTPIFITFVSGWGLPHQHCLTTYLMGKFIKKIITAVWYTLFIGVLLIAVVFGLMLSPSVQKHVSNALENVLHEATGLPVKVGNVKYFPLTTVKISEIGIADRDTMPMMVLMSAKADLSLLSFFERSLIFNSVDVDSLGFFVRKDADGHFNFEAIATDSTNSTQSTNVSLPVIIKAVRAQNCEVRLVQDGNEHLRLNNLGLDVANIEAHGGNINAVVNRFSFDMPNLGKRFDAKALVALKNDTLSVKGLNASLGRLSKLNADSFVFAQDTSGIAFLALNVQKCQLDKELTSYLAGRPMPSFALEGFIGADSLNYFAKDLHLSCGNNTELALSGSIDRLWRQNDNAKSKIEIKRLSTTISAIKELTGASPDPHDDIAMGNIVFKGTLSALGKDINLRLDGNALAAQAHVFATAQASDDWSKADFSTNIKAEANLKWLSNSKVGDIALEINADGNASTDEIFYAKLNCDIESAELLGHPYNGIKLSGLYADKHLDALASIDDAYGQLLILAESDLKGRETPFAITLKADDIRLAKLNLWDGHGNPSISTKLRLEASSTNPDKATADLVLANLFFTDSNDTASLNKLHLSLQDSDDGDRLLSLSSDFGNAEMKGKFSFNGIANEISYQVKTASPVLFGPPAKSKAKTPRQEAELSLAFHDIQPFSHIFLPSLSVPKTISLNAHLDSEDHSISLNAHLDVEVLDVDGRVGDVWC